MEIPASVFQITTTPFYTVFYLMDTFSQNFDVFKSKFERIVSELFYLFTKDNRSMIIGLEDMGSMEI